MTAKSKKRSARKSTVATRDIFAGLVAIRELTGAVAAMGEDRRLLLQSFDEERKELHRRIEELKLTAESQRGKIEALQRTVDERNQLSQRVIATQEGLRESLNIVLDAVTAEAPRLRSRILAAGFSKAMQNADATKEGK